jgi:RNA recognition motif-containing protein
LRSFLLEHLREYFSNFGAVESVTVKYDKSGRSKGFGFVLFEDQDTPNKVYSQDVHIIQGKRVDTKSAHRRDQALARKVFVGGLDPEITDEELQEYFSQFGTVRVLLSYSKFRKFSLFRSLKSKHLLIKSNKNVVHFVLFFLKMNKVPKKFLNNHDIH